MRCGDQRRAMTDGTSSAALVTESERGRPTTAVGAPALSCRDVSVHFGDFRALDGVSATFAAGGIHAIVGQNGAGKTTLSRVLAGLIRPDAGSVSIGGATVSLADGVSAARRQGV